jgi:chromosome segregation ATPase
MVFNLGTIEIVSLLLGAIVFGFALHFFIIYRRSLKQALQKKPDNRVQFRYETPQPVKRKAEEPKYKKEQTPEPKNIRTIDEPRLAIRRPEPVKEESIRSLKDVISQQQNMLSTLLKKAEDLQHSELAEQNEDLQNRIADLTTALDEKDQELATARDQAAAAQKMASRIEEVYQEFDSLQERIMDLEKQASHANSLAMELEDMRDGYESLRKDLMRKQARLEETVAENQRLHHDLGEAEDKLSEANLQRQQLQKKVQFLQDMNGDMQDMSDNNKKLQTELRRIGELESMLNMIAEERDHLLKKQFGK